MPPELDDLLDQWEEARRRGEEIAAEALCRDRPDLLAECRRQIAALSKVDRWLDDVPTVDGAHVTAQRYQAVRFHARGGLGEVYLARDRLLSRPVALKQLQDRHAGDPGLRRRFVREAEITAQLQHPGIVPVYDLAESNAGRPTYAMRFIEGQSLAAAIDGVRRGRRGDFLSVAFSQLIRRVVDACNAVAYAHSRGFVHRDLKPANIMLGDFGETLVVDWGLAKAVGQPPADNGAAVMTPPPRSVTDVTTPSPRGEATMPGSVLGTPFYMSPEQAAGREVTPATDVYSLGATLYHLLTGKPPHTGRDWLPPRGASPRVSAVPPETVNPAIPAPLAAVCRRAMAEQPADRYAGALELAADLERWLADEPVSACREPWLSRLARRLRRHATLAASAGVLLVTASIGLAVGAALIGQQQRRTAEERDHAVKERQVSDAVRHFLQFDLLRQASAYDQARSLVQSGGSAADVRDNPTVKELLDRAAARLTPATIDDSFPGQPEVQAEILVNVGETYQAVGQLATAVEYLRRGSDLCISLYGPTHERSLAARLSLGTALTQAGEFAQAIPTLEAIRDDCRNQLGPDHPDTLAAMHQLAQAYHGAGRPEGVALMETVRTARANIFGEEDRLTLKSVAALAGMYRETGRPAEGLALLEQVDAIRTRRLGPDHPDTLGNRSNLVAAYYSAGRLDDAVKLSEAMLPTMTAQLGPDHPDTLTVVNNLAVALLDTNRVAEAIPLLKRVVESRQRKMPPDHPRTIAALNNLGKAYERLGKSEDAIVAYEQAYAAAQRKLGGDHRSTQIIGYNLGELYWKVGRYDDVLSVMKKVHAGRVRVLGADDPLTLLAQQMIGLTYYSLGLPGEAIPELEAVRIGRVKKWGESYPDTLVAKHNLASAYVEAGRLPEAIALFEEVKAARMVKPDFNDANTLGTLASLGSAYNAAGRFADAEAVLRQLVDARAEADADHWRLFTWRSALGEALAGQKKPGAEALLLDSAEGLRQRRDRISPPHRRKAFTQAWDRVIRFYESKSDAEKAATWRAEKEAMLKR